MTHHDDVRAAAQSVALNWRDAGCRRNDQVIDDQLRRSLDRLLAVFDQHAARRLGESYARLGIERSDFWEEYR